MKTKKTLKINTENAEKAAEAQKLVFAIHDKMMDVRDELHKLEMICLSTLDDMEKRNENWATYMELSKYYDQLCKMSGKVLWADVK